MSLRFVVLNTNSYVENVKQQINIICFDKLNCDPSFEFKQKVIDWIEIKDTNDMLHSIDSFSESILADNLVLVSFDVVNYVSKN